MIAAIKNKLYRAPWLLLLIPALAFWQITFFANTMKWDMLDQNFPWHRFISECFRQHILPYWCPYSRLGYPFFADPQSGMFYPVAWIFALVGRYTLYSNNWEFIFHVTLAAVGMRVLLRSVGVARSSAYLFGAVYAMSGPMVSNATHIILIHSLCWLPFILGSYVYMLRSHHTRYALATAFFLSMQVCGGYAGLTIILGYLLAGGFLYWLLSVGVKDREALLKAGVNSIIVLVTTVALCAGFLYAVSYGLPYIDRTAGVTKQMANGIAFTPRSFITFILPLTSGNADLYFGTDSTMNNLYVGLLSLLFIVPALIMYPSRFKWVLVFVSVFFLLVAMGGSTPMRGWLYDYVPLMKLFRHAAIFRFITAMSLVVLAALSFEDILGTDNAMLRQTKWVFVLAFISFLACTVLILCVKFQMPPLGHILSLFDLSQFFVHTSKWSVIVFNALLQITILGCAIFFLIKKDKSTTKWGLAFLMLVEMIISVQGNAFFTVASPLSVHRIQSTLDKMPVGFPIPDNVPLNSCNEWNDQRLAPPMWHNAGFARKQISYEGYNGFNLSAYNELADRKDFQEIISNHCLISAAPDTADIKINAFDPNTIRFEVKSDHSVMLHIGQIFFPGWHLYIDGSEQKGALDTDDTKLLRAQIPSGDHSVSLVFEPAGVKLAFFYTVIMFLLVGSSTAFLFMRAED